MKKYKLYSSANQRLLFLLFSCLYKVHCKYNQILYHSAIQDLHYDALKLKMGRMMVSMVTVSPILAMISEAGL